MEKNYIEKEKRKFRLPAPGQRIIRSVVAVALCFVIYYLRGKRGIPFYSALAVLQCIQPYQTSMKEMAKKRTIGTFVGAFWGFVVISILLLTEGKGQSGVIEESFIKYMLISIFTGIVLYSTVVLNCKKSSYFSCVVFLSITVMHITDEAPFLFVLNRVLDTMIGIVLAIIVNSVHLPRKKQNQILFVSGIDDTILNSESQLTPYSKVELNRVIESGAQFTISTIRTPASVKEALEGVHLKLPIIAMDGAVLYDMEENSFLMKYQMSDSQATAMSGFLNQEGINYFTNTVVDDLLVIYYQNLSNEAEKGIYEKRRKSPYRNYVRTDHPVCENVVYFLVIDKKERIEALYQKLLQTEWTSCFRIVLADSVNYPGYAHIKIYQKQATRENMLKNLEALTDTEKTVTFGSVEGKYDVFIANADRNIMVKELKRRYEPVEIN